MIHFLNTVLADDIKDNIIVLHYDNTERLGVTKYDRKAFYDLVCVTEKGHIIVEMQAVWQEHYKDRVLGYAAQLIQNLSVKGKEWDFKLSPIYSINILNFLFDPNDLLSKKYASYI